MKIAVKFTVKDKRKFQGYLEQCNGGEEQAYKLWLRWKCQTDLYFLGAEVLGLKDARFHGRRRLDPKMHKRMAEEMEREEDTMQLYPRLHMKSCWIKFYMVQRILRNPNVRIGLWSRTIGLAKKMLRSVARYLEMPILMELFPDILPPRNEWEKDSEIALTTKRDPEVGYVPDQAMVEAWGIAGTITGNHYDYQIYDDVINRHSVTTATQIEKVEDWYEAMQSILDMDSIEKMVGTRYHLHDIYGFIIAGGFFDAANIIIKKAINEINGKLLYSFFTKKYLQKIKRRIGDYKFSCQYQNTPVPQGDRIFIPPYPVYPVEHFPKNPKYYISVDPAPTTRAHSNQTGICVAAVDKDAPNKAFVVEAIGVKLLPNELADLIVSKTIQYRPTRLGIEFGLQQALLPLLNIKMREWEGDNGGDYLTRAILPIPTGKASKADKFNRTIGAFMRDKRLLLPGKIGKKGELLPADSMKALITQMDFYNPHTDKNDDDIIDAGAIMIQTIEHFAPAHWFNSENQLDKDPYTFTVQELMDMGKKKDRNKWGWNLAC